MRQRRFPRGVLGLPGWCALLAAVLVLGFLAAPALTQPAGATAEADRSEQTTTDAPAPAAEAQAELTAADEATVDESAPAGAAATRAEGTRTSGPWWVVLYWALAFVGSVTALVFAYIFFKKMKESDPGNERMQEIAGYVRTGANAYLWQQYKVVAIFFVVIFLLLLWAAFGLGVQSKWVPFAFITGGFFSGLSGWFGMKTATWASNRTAAGAQKSLNQGLQVAFRSGAVMGLTVVGLGLLDICLWFAVLYWLVPMINPAWSLTLVEITVTMLCFGMGASSQALFARVGGGIFTKAADVGADLVGKVEAGIPEDDPRNPATIADNVGDNVGDVAGMGADLYESYCGSILATAALGVAAFSTPDLIAAVTGQEWGAARGLQTNYMLAAMLLPMVLAGVGIGLSIMGIFLVRTEEQATQKVLLKALARGIDISSVGIIAVTFLFTYLMMPDFWFGVAMSVVVGLAAGWLIGKWTEYSTSNEYRPTKELADQALTGPATIIIGGIADGMKSVWFPIIVVSAATLLAFGFASSWQFADVAWFSMGLYGVGIAAVGMLSTLGITLATDAYGPIADNAGGNAEMSHLEPVVRQRTDALDALGNTTAATGKGFAIGSAALTALALLAAYVEEVRVGFERWADERVGVASAQIEPGYYKLSPKFVAERLAQPDPVTGEYYRGFLAFPESVDSPEVRKTWREIAIGSDEPSRIPDDVFTTRVNPETGDEVLAFSATGARLAELRAATMPDFMRYYEAHLMNPKVLVGVFLGAMATFLFCALTMKAVGRAAKGMVEEVRRQFREKPGIMEGTELPDYAAPVAISTKAAQKEMILPSILGLSTPVIVGLLLGVPGVLGLLVGGLACGFCVAVFMANAGGSWDNAKKHIEGGAHGGKRSDAHKAAVVGDTVGDPFKDTSGPSLNILIKLMSMVSVVVAGLIVRYSLYALGIF